MTNNLQTCFHKCLCKASCIFSAFNPLTNLVARLYLANIFFKSGLTKTDNWSATLYLFEHEYKVPLLSFSAAAIVATVVELAGSVSLAFGLGTRYAATALFLMTVIMNFTYQEMPENYYWMIILAMIITQGGRRISLDYLIKRKCCNGNHVNACCAKTCGHGMKAHTSSHKVDVAPKKTITKKKK